MVRYATLGGLLLLWGATDDQRSKAHPAQARGGSRLTPPATGGTQRAARRALRRPKRVPTDQDILDQAQAAYIKGVGKLSRMFLSLNASSGANTQVSNSDKSCSSAASTIT